MKYFQILAVIFIAMLFQQAFAVETSMTPEAKQKALDSLAAYEQQQITKLTTQSDEAIENGMACGGDSCPVFTQQQSVQSDEVFDGSEPMVHRATVYFINDALFLSNYGYLEEVFFSLKGEELSMFKQTVLYHYLGYKSDDFKAKLIVTTEAYVGIEMGVTSLELQTLAETDTRITQIRHKGNSGSIMLR